MSATATCVSADSAWDSFRATSRFGNLDGLRCFSIIGVIWSHGPGVDAKGYGGQVDVGVQLFFAISGFLITTLLLRERDRNGSVSLAKFYARRSLRIFPLYYAVLGTYVVLMIAMMRGTERGDLFFHNLPYFLTYTSNWFVSPLATLSFAWSLAAEEQFYCTWPWVFRFTRPLVAAGLVAALLVARVAWNLFGASDGSAGAPQGVSLPWIILDSVQMAICLGCLLAFALHSRLGFEWLWKLAGWRWSQPLAVVILLVTIGFYRTHATPVHLAAAFLVATCVIREDTLLAPLLRHRWIVHIGIVSYGMYMLHNLVYDALTVGVNQLFALDWDSRRAAGFLPALALTVAIATLSYRLFESRLLRLKPRS